MHLNAVHAMSEDPKVEGYFKVCSSLLLLLLLSKAFQKMSQKLLAVPKITLNDEISYESKILILNG